MALSTCQISPLYRWSPSADSHAFMVWSVTVVVNEESQCFIRHRKNVAATTSQEAAEAVTRLCVQGE